jgi:hypothetical protein
MMRNDTVRGNRAVCRGMAWPALLVSAAAFMLAGCGGGSGTPQVASLDTAAAAQPAGGTAPPARGTSSRSSSVAMPGNVTSLLNQWAACERGNGDPQQADPTVDASGVIWIIVPRQAQLAGNLHELDGTCTQYLGEAQNELKAANPVQPAPDNAEDLKWIGCVRANGVPDYPYPTGDTTNFQGSGVDPDSPYVVRVETMCGKKLGLPTWWAAGTHIPGSIEVRTAGEPLNPTAPACFFRKADPCSGDITESPGAAANG